MKKLELRAERRFFPSFDLKLSVESALRFAAEFACIFLMASTERFGFAMATALFCGLVYARQNALALAPAYIVACVVFDLNWLTPIFCIANIICLVLLYIIFYRLKKNVPLWSVAVAVAVGLVPYVACRCALSADFVGAGVSVLVAVVMTFVSGITSYAVFVRGLSLSLTADELICGGAFIAAFGMALYAVNIFDFRIFNTCIAFCAMICSICLKPQYTLFVCLLMGIGASISGGALSLAAYAALIAAAAITFSPFTKWASALAVLACEGVMWLLSAYPSAGWRAFIMTAVGIVCALCVPKTLLCKAVALNQKDNQHVFSGIVNRRGREFASRLYSASDVFYEMSKSMEGMISKADAYTADNLAAEIAVNYCGRCPERDNCFSALGCDTRNVIKPMAEAALGRGKATILDMPAFVTSRCARTHALEAVINSSAEVYRKRREQSDGIILGKRMMSEQFAGVALILDSLAQESSRQVTFSGAEVETIKAELMKHNVFAFELVISSSDDVVFATALVRSEDADKQILPKTVGNMLRRNLEVARVEDKGEQKLVYMQCSPTFEIAYGIAEKIRSEEGVSGDSKSVLCPSPRQRLFAICDGMGSGEKAAQVSRRAVSMIESFYRAGFDSKIILSLINKLLKISVEDSFSSLDIAVIDTSTGGLDVIKLGAANSYIIRRDGIETLMCDAPPAGIVDGVKPQTNRYQLYDGDMVIMMSDGIADALGDKGVYEVVETLDTFNPQLIADRLLSTALALGSKDDCTALVLRLFVA